MESLWNVHMVLVWGSETIFVESLKNKVERDLKRLPSPIPCPNNPSVCLICTYKNFQVLIFHNLSS